MRVKQADKLARIEGQTGIKATIKRAMIQNGIKQNEMAERLQVKPQTLGEFLRLPTAGSLEMAENLLKELGLKIVKLD